jgi:uncharacterized small protein (DUF1192 family)
MGKAPVPTAKEINDAHQFAKEHAETAIEWAVKCGQMLARKKDELGRGFVEWQETYCKFSRAMAYNYMKAAKSSNALDGFSSLRQALGYESQKPGAKKSLTGAKADAGAGAEPVPAKPEPAPAATKPEPTPVSSTDEPERPDDSDEDAHIAAAELELAASVDKVMQSDDRLAAAYAEIKRLTAELAVVKLSRDGYMRGKEAVTKLLKTAQRQIAALEKKVKGK